MFISHGLTFCFHTIALPSRSKTENVLCGYFKLTQMSHALNFLIAGMVD